MTDCWFVLGHADDPRVTGFQAALAPSGRTLRVLPYQAVMDDTALSWAPTDNLRLESPGWHVPTVRHFMQQGMLAATQAGFAVCSRQQLQDAALEAGEFIAPHQFHYGFKRHLERLAARLVQQPVRSCMQYLPDIICCYDKTACHARLQQAGIPVPGVLPAVSSYAELRALMRSVGWSRVFVKSRFGSGGSGIVALACHTRGPVQAYTTLRLQDGRLFSERRVRHLRSEADIALLVDRLCRWGVQVERWIPKADLQGQGVDLRVLLVAGEPVFCVLRKSQTPITNLYLRNARADCQVLRALMRAEDWEALLASCRAVGRVFPHSFYLGLDVAVDVSLRRHVVLEVNAFGDFLHHVRYQGLNPYQWELQAFPAWQHRQH